MCFYAATLLNFLPQKLHWTISGAGCFSAYYSSGVRGIPFDFLIFARKTRLCRAHLGLEPSLFAAYCFPFLDTGATSFSSSISLCSAAQNSFLFSWKTFLQTLACFSRAFWLKERPHQDIQRASYFLEVRPPQSSLFWLKQWVFPAFPSSWTHFYSVLNHYWLRWVGPVAGISEAHTEREQAFRMVVPDGVLVSKVLVDFVGWHVRLVGLEEGVVGLGFWFILVEVPVLLLGEVEPVSHCSLDFCFICLEWQLLYSYTSSHNEQLMSSCNDLWWLRRWNTSSDF